MYTGYEGVNSVSMETVQDLTLLPEYLCERYPTAMYTGYERVNSPILYGDCLLAMSRVGRGIHIMLLGGHDSHIFW